MIDTIRTTTVRNLLHRIRGEFLEMPGLSLTPDQARRLWAVDRQTCSRVLAKLVRTGFLRRRRDGSYIRQSGCPDAAFATGASRG